MFLYPFRVLSIVQLRKRLSKKRESQKTANKTRRDPFFFSFSAKRKIPRWYKCKLVANFGGICSRVWKSSQAFQSFPYLSFQNSVVEPKTTWSFLDDSKTPE